MKISMIGLGKLGLEAAKIINKSYPVIGYDINTVVAPFPVVNTIKDAIKNSEFIFVAVPTPHHSEYSGSNPTSHLPPKDFDYTILKSVLIEISKHLTPEQQVCVICTVMPGTTRRELATIIPNILYTPTVIAQGTVAKDFENPEIVIIGGEPNNPNRARLAQFYRSINGESVHLVEGEWEDAELTKIFYNTFLTYKITLANTIHDMVQKLGYGNSDIVTNGLANCTRKISAPAYMTAGMGVGGPCHPRDIIAMNWFSQSIDLGYDLFGNLSQIREIQAKNLANKLSSYGLPVVILGRGFKENIAQHDGSYAMLVGHYIDGVSYHDPLNNLEYSGTEPVVYLVSYHHDWLKDYKFILNSIVIDPWRKNLSIPNCNVINF
jgi:UDPglucose 6-dehydrogenase